MIDRSNSYPLQEVLVLSGPLTASNSSTFQNAMRREDPADTVILDLSDVPYIDSAGLGLLVTAYVTRQKSGRKMVLSGINSRVQRLFDITRVASLFLIFSSPEEAIAALRSTTSSKLLQPRILGFGLLENRNIRISIFPGREEILIRRTCFGVVTL